MLKKAVSQRKVRCVDIVMMVASEPKNSLPEILKTLELLKSKISSAEDAAAFNEEVSVMFDLSLELMISD